MLTKEEFEKITNELLSIKETENEFVIKIEIYLDNKIIRLYQYNKKSNYTGEYDFITGKKRLTLYYLNTEGQEKAIQRIKEEIESAKKEVFLNVMMSLVKENKHDCENCTDKEECDLFNEMMKDINLFN